jgi:hypothetical protein
MLSTVPATKASSNLVDSFHLSTFSILFESVEQADHRSRSSFRDSLSEPVHWGPVHSLRIGDLCIWGPVHSLRKRSIMVLPWFDARRRSAALNHVKSWYFLGSLAVLAAAVVVMAALKVDLQW